KSAQIREILISESAWEEMTCLFAPSLGEMSMIIYLLHILVASGSRVILIKVLHVNDWIAHLTIGLLAGIIIPILIYRYIKNTKLKYLFSL
ncbi:hypothetical protein LVT68_25740, partial [Klebsiella pneumoniae]|nr:hypothetical protein [Klebsiella pneumoniae]